MESFGHSSRERYHELATAIAPKIRVMRCDSQPGLRLGI
jgi:hypothetical protein